MIDRSFIEKIEEMAEAHVITVDSRPYSDKALHAITPPMAKALEVRTLTAIKDYLDKDPDELSFSDLVIHVFGPENVALYSKLSSHHRQRECFMAARPVTRKFPFGQYVQLEQFIISLQTMFVQDAITARILKLVGNLTDSKTTQFNDDGVTQQVTAKTGVAKVENVEVPSPVMLRPFRTFLELEQPDSLFIFRIRAGAGGASPSAPSSRQTVGSGSWKPSTG